MATTFSFWTRSGCIVLSSIALSACNPGFDLPFGQSEASSANSPDLTRPAAAAQSETNGLEVEAPDVFFLEETGLWDGRPSLGGVWVAHPDVGDPERVLVTNLDNGETVVGALFRRERENYGPEIMVSSDAAAALNVIAGQPTQFTVVALRPQEIPEELDLAVAPPEPEALEDGASALPTAVAATTLAAETVADAPVEAAAPTPNLDVAALAENAIAVSASPAPAPVPVATLDAAAILAETTAGAVPAALLAETAPEEPAPVAAPAPRPVETAAVAAEPLPVPEPIAAATLPEPAEREDLARPYIQVGVFSAEANAETAASEMRQGGVIPTVLDQSNEERALWRVIVGPVRNSEERAALLETVHGLGYEDAYFVTN